jgi:peptidoglycan/LPS O-acetylase OafA/YrhL
MKAEPVDVRDPLDLERSAPAEIAPVAPPRDEIKALTGLRFLAACWVLAAHFQPVLEGLWPAAAVLEPFARDGNMGVDLFFILSGFILIYNYRETFQRIGARTYLRFLGLRLARIYPVHLFVLALFGLYVAVDKAGGAPAHHEAGVFTLAGFVKHFFLIQAWGFGDSATWNQPAWSLSAEWFAYLLFPFLAWAILRFGSLRLLVGAALIGGPAGLLLMTMLDRFPPFLALLRIGVTFTLGCLLGILFLDGVGAGIRAWGAVAGVAAAGIVVASLVLPDACCAEYGSVIPLMAVFIFALARERGALANLLSTRRAMFWGGASYALYMTHWLILALGRVFLPPGSFASSSLPVRSVVVVAYLIAFFGAAAITFVVIERPARKGIRDVMASV